jgi:hypothetical protein
MLHQQQLCLQTLDKILLVRRFLLNEGVELLYKVAVIYPVILPELTSA